MGLGFHRSGSKCSCQREFLGDQGMLSLDKASISAKYRSIINTTYKKQGLYNERRQPSQTFKNPNGFFALHFSFPAKSGQIPAGKNWQISISLWVINSEKRAVSKPVLWIVLVSVSVAINNRNWKYLGWLQTHFFLLLFRDVFQHSFPKTIYTYQSLYLTSWNIQNKLNLPSKFALLVLHKDSPLLSTYNH